MKQAARGESRAAQELASGGAMDQRIRAMSWAATPLGDLQLWPQSLRTALSLCLNSPTASAIGWGPSRVLLYNDRYAPLCDPHALGRDFAEGCRELWPALQAAFERAAQGEPSDAEARPAPLSFSFQPILDESDGVGGVWITVADVRDHDAFNYAISHDVRSPLRSMEQMAHILLEDHAPQLPEDVRHFLDRVAQTTATLGERAEGILSFNRVSHQPLALQRVHVRPLVDAVVAELRANSDNRRADVIVGELPDVRGDPDLLRLVFSHLLTNAFKFTRATEQPRIEIDARAQGRQVAYCIADNGMGFDMKYAGKLFVLFHRLHGDPQLEGPGIGLALTRRIIERHGGAIRVEAIKAHGVTVQFTLPAA